MHSALSGTAHVATSELTRLAGKRWWVDAREPEPEPDWSQHMQASCAREYIARLRRPASTRKKQLLVTKCAIYEPLPLSNPWRSP